MRLGRFCLGMAIAGAMLLTASCDRASGAESRLIVGTSTSSSLDAYARALASVSGGRYIVQSMPGAGSIRSVQYMMKQAPRDGSVLAISSPFALIGGLYHEDGFDPRGLTWIGAFERTSSICMARPGSGVRSVQDMQRREFVVGSTGAGAAWENLPVLINATIGTKIKVISGYSSGAEIINAVERGELDGQCGIGLASLIHQMRPEWLGPHKMSVPIVVSMHRSSAFPGSPALGEMISDPRQRMILEEAMLPERMSRPLYGPPDIGRAQALLIRKDWMTLVSDPRFRQLLPPDPGGERTVDGVELTDMVMDAFAIKVKLAQR